LFDPLDGGDDLVGVGRIADLEGVVQHDAVVVVGDLGLVAELDGRAEPSLADGPSVGFVLGHDPGRSRCHGASDPGACLVDNPVGDTDEVVAVVDHLP
jgi:hypothetical protein